MLLNFISVGVEAANMSAELTKPHGLNSSFSPITIDVPHVDDDPFEFQPVPCAEVRKMIVASSANKAPSYNKGPISVVKDCFENILPTINEIINPS